MPRIKELESLQPNLQIKISTSHDDDQTQEMEYGDVTNIVITRGLNGIPSYESHLLFSENLTLACSSENYELINSNLNEIKNFRILKAEKNLNYWNRWLNNNNLDYIDIANSITFDTLALVISSIEMGYGIGLIDPRMAKMKISNGSIMFPENETISTGYRYYINIPPHNNPLINGFLTNIMKLCEE